MNLVPPSFRDPRPAARRPAARRPSAERGVALVITLILLSVTLIMALAFLALSRREREAVATATDATQARLAADNALAAAQAQIVANIFATSNAFSYGLLVSTNYINPNGYDTAILGTDPQNVSYNYPAGGFLTGADLAQNIANLQILPRPPVFISGNPVTNGTDFRFYLDLNRNGRFDTNGSIGEIGANGVATGNQLFAVGDPEWVGLLERPDTTHSPNNKFVSRYAFIAVPADNALDINAIHNQAYTKSLNLANDGYFRNQGVGSWELNLAAFFADLNADIWNNPVNGGVYQYLRPNFPNTGAAFSDAQAVLNYRYGGNYNNLASAGQVFSNYASAFFDDNIDEYSDGPLQTNLPNINEALNSLGTDGDLNPRITPWPGSDNTNRFYALPADLFDPAKLPPAKYNLIANLSMSGSSNATYDRYTFYRLLGQLGTDSSPEPPKLNLNFMNVDTNGNIVSGMETNQIRWTNALVFFTNAADRLLHLYTTNWFQGNPSNFLWSYYNIVVTNIVGPGGNGLTNVPYYGMTNQIPGFGIGNIPVNVNGQFVYAPSVNRLLQLAANIYDASTNSRYPSVFRPLFSRDQGGRGTNLFVSGYTNVDYVASTEIGNTNAGHIFALPMDAGQLAYASGTVANMAVNVYGVPWIIGAKKGLPNFQHLALSSQMLWTRKLNFTRPTVGGPITTNEGYYVSVTNNLNLAYWNSYISNYSGNLYIYALDSLQMVWSNNGTITPLTPRVIPFWTNFTIWPGAHWSGNVPQNQYSQTGLPYSFISFNATFPFFTQSPTEFWASDGTFHFDTNNFDPGAIKPLPPINLTITNQFYSYILDGTHVIDFVELASPSESTDVTNALMDKVITPSTTTMWTFDLKNGVPGVPSGVFNQASLSMGGTVNNRNFWQAPPNFPTVGATPDAVIANQQQYLRDFITGNPNNTDLSEQAPYTPSRYITLAYLLQANDPLVHYLASDLGGLTTDYNTWGDSGNYTNGVWISSDNVPTLIPSIGFNAVPGRYQPWGIIGQMKQIGSISTSTYDSSLKDPLAWGSDYWDFPTNSYPSVGWLGRVHRGTPWQTVYLKADNILSRVGGIGDFNIGTNIWDKWTGDLDPFEAANAAPFRDRLLFDVFTTGLNDNATRGTLSVNQTNLAAWSALFSGMVAISNTMVNPYIAPTTASWIINPVGTSGNSGLWQIYKDIVNQNQGNAFAHMGDILSVPALSTSSPYLNTGISTFMNSSFSQYQRGVSDEMYEWLPSKALSLLRDSPTPRYVVYGYGQALRPAQGSTYSGNGALFGLVTNYQVMAESAVRAVVQVHPQIIKLPSSQIVTNANGTISVIDYVTNYTTTVESYDVLPPN